MTEQSFDACLQLVADSRRRRTVQQLRHADDGKTTVDDLVDRLHSGEPVSDVDRQRLAIQLSHVHLPKLDDHGVVEYDRESGTVQYQPNPQI